MLALAVTTPFACLHVEVNDRLRRSERGVAQAQDRAVIVSLTPWTQAVSSLWKLNLLPGA